MEQNGSHGAVSDDQPFPCNRVFCVFFQYYSTKPHYKSHKNKRTLKLPSDTTKKEVKFDFKLIMCGILDIIAIQTTYCF